jgi:hypothetical protein
MSKDVQLRLYKVTAKSALMFGHGFWKGRTRIYWRQSNGFRQAIAGRALRDHTRSETIRQKLGAKYNTVEDTEKHRKQ